MPGRVVDPGHSKVFQAYYIATYPRTPVFRSSIVYIPFTIFMHGKTITPWLGNTVQCQYTGNSVDRLFGVH